MMNSETLQTELSQNIRSLGRPQATKDIVSEMKKLIRPNSLKN